MSKNDKKIAKNDEELNKNSLKEWIEDTSNGDICPVCGGEIFREGHCKTCIDCGWSLCDV